MAKQPAKTAETPKENETLNGSNTLPAVIQFAPDKSVPLGEIVMKAHQASGLSVEAWNALAEAERDELLNKTIEDLRPVVEAAAVDQTLNQALAGKAALLTAVDELQGLPQPATPLESVQITAIRHPEAYEALFEQIREQLAGMDADVAEVVLTDLQRAVDAIGEKKLPHLPEPTPMIFAEQVLIVSAPAGPRRRAGLGFGPVPVELRWDELGEDPEATLEALRADPMLKIDGRFEERPADEA